MSYRADRNIVCSFVKEAIDGAQRDLRVAYNSAFNLEDIPRAMEKCFRAISLIREAEEHLDVSSEIISKQKRKVFESDLHALVRALWCLTKDISKKTRSCYIGREQTSALRMHFLAYSCEPQKSSKSVEAEFAGLY